jgi:hypothetical protein
MGLAGGTEPPRKGDAGGLCNYSSTYDRGATIQHWQLRDLVHCPSKDEELFCVYRHRTLRHDLASGKTEVVQELPFEPTSMTVAHGYVAAGGQNSQLDARRLGGGEVVYKGHCGGSVNNALHIGRDASQQLRLFVCNNDDTIKVYGLQGGALATVLRCPVAINYCALSPSGRHLVCVGDNRHTYLYQATPAAYRQCGVFTEACDAGMCCAWSASGSMFASASQDGSVAVWDHRSSALVAHFLTPLVGLRRWAAASRCKLPVIVTPLQQRDCCALPHAADAPSGPPCHPPSLRWGQLFTCAVAAGLPPPPPRPPWGFQLTYRLSLVSSFLQACRNVSCPHTTYQCHTNLSVPVQVVLNAMLSSSPTGLPQRQVLARPARPAGVCGAPLPLPPGGLPHVGPAAGAGCGRAGLRARHFGHCILALRPAAVCGH